MMMDKPLYVTEQRARGGDLRPRRVVKKDAARAYGNDPQFANLMGGQMTGGQTAVRPNRVSGKSDFEYNMMEGMASGATAMPNRSMAKRGRRADMPYFDGNAAANASGLKHSAVGNLLGTQESPRQRGVPLPLLPHMSPSSQDFHSALDGKFQTASGPLRSTAEREMFRQEKAAGGQEKFYKQFLAAGNQQSSYTARQKTPTTMNMMGGMQPEVAPQPRNPGRRKNMMNPMSELDSGDSDDDWKQEWQGDAMKAGANAYASMLGGASYSTGNAIHGNIQGDDNMMSVGMNNTTRVGSLGGMNKLNPLMSGHGRTPGQPMKTARQHPSNGGGSQVPWYQVRVSMLKKQAAEGRPTGAVTHR